MGIKSRAFQGFREFRYGFGSQEKDNEVSGDENSTTAEYWQYDTRLGRRFNMDPRPNSSLSSYSTFSNNPIYFIDIKGDTTYNFSSKNGSFLGVTDLDKKGNVGVFVSITEKIAKDGTKTFDRKIDAKFVFNDIDLDMSKVWTADANELKKIRAIIRTEDHIDKAMDFNGVKTDEAQSGPWIYIERESRPKGKTSILSGTSTGLLDHYSTSPIVIDNVLNVVLFPGSKVGVAYNDMDFGNFLWGHAGKMLGFSIVTLSQAAHLNNAVNGSEDNAGMDVGILDAPSDQRAIMMGYLYPVKK